jgi:hypothetical protein
MYTDPLLLALRLARTFDALGNAVRARITLQDERLREELARRRLVRLEADDPTSTVAVASPEDAVLHKLEWFRDGGGVSDRQWRDVLGVLKVQGESLELDYLRRRAAQLATGELLERALDEAGEW